MGLLITHGRALLKKILHCVVVSVFVKHCESFTRSVFRRTIHRASVSRDSFHCGVMNCLYNNSVMLISSDTSDCSAVKLLNRLNMVGEVTDHIFIESDPI